MATLEELTPGASVRGIIPDALVTVVSTQWFGSEALELTYKTPTGKVANQLVYRHDEPNLEVAELGRPWSFDGDGALFRLVSEAQRIRLAHLFDPVLAVHTSVVEPLPHQITAVYESMLPRQPLRFLLARRQMDAEATVVVPPLEPGKERGKPDGQGAPTGQPQMRRFHGRVSLDAVRVGAGAAKIGEEVISHLAGLIRADVKVTLEIEAHLPDGATEQVVRTVTENCRTLKFESQGFEKE